MGAELDLIGQAIFDAAAFVLHGHGRAGPAAGWEFDGIGDAVEAQAAVMEHDGAFDAGAAGVVVAGEVCAFVEEAAGGGGGVFFPGAFDVDEGGLAFTEEEMLEGRDGDEVVGFA